MSEQTVREQLAEVLEGLGSQCIRCQGLKVPPGFNGWHRLNCEHFHADRQKHLGWIEDDCDEACRKAHAALDRHRAEPEEK